jgi:putative DNA primase/helicase
MGDRAKDNWMPLLAIADTVGGGWAERARDAALALSRVDPDDEDIKIQLLMDIFKVFEATGAENSSSEDLVQALCKQEERPWGGTETMRRLTKAALARMLAPFRIKPVQARFDHTPKRGYSRRQFEDAWSRYLPPEL